MRVQNLVNLSSIPKILTQLSLPRTPSIPFSLTSRLVPPSTTTPARTRFISHYHNHTSSESDGFSRTGRLIIILSSALIGTLASALIGTLAYTLIQNTINPAPLNTAQLIRKAEKVIDRLALMQTKDHLTASDQKTLTEFSEFYGNIQIAPMVIEIPNPYDSSHPKEIEVKNALSIECLNSLSSLARSSLIERLKLALRARLGASTYEPRTVYVNGTQYTVHNSFVELHSRYNENRISGLLELLDQKGVFNVYSDPRTGLVRTSETANLLMTRQWLTDDSQIGLMQKVRDPFGWKKVLLVHAAVLSAPETISAIERVTHDSSWFRTISSEPDQAQVDGRKGIPHIFDPMSIQFVPLTEEPLPHKIVFDGSFNRKRLESFASVLRDLLEALIKEGPQESIQQAAFRVANYLIAVNTDPLTGKIDMQAPSGSSWEEFPFPGGATSDTGLTVIAFELLKNFLETSSLTQPPMSSIDDVITVGRRLVNERIVKPLQEGKMPKQFLSRGPDTSLLFLGASEYKFDSKDSVRDAQIRLDLYLTMKRTLLGSHGMRRYGTFVHEGKDLHDSYLNIDFHQPASLRAALEGQVSSTKEHGSKDASGLADLEERQLLSRPEYAAEWCLGVSASLQTLARAKIELLSALEKNKGASPKERELLYRINREITHIINLNLALISGPLKSGQVIIRSDGTNTPPNSVIEAYEVVRDLQGNPKRIPGAHTLAWGVSQLYDGLRKAKEAASLEERLINTGLLK